jgi:hypothetical protein
MRALLHACLTLYLAAAASNALAQNTASPNAKAADQKPAAAVDDKKSADASKSSDAKKPADSKAVGNKAADGKKPDSKAGDPSAGDSSAAQPSGEKDSRKTAKAEGPACVVAEFRALGIDVHDPVKRRTQAMTWLKKRAKNCSVDQLLMIRNNRSQWMGTADSAAMAAEVDSLLEVFAADNPQVAALLYGTVPPPAEGQAGK